MYKSIQKYKKYKKTKIANAENIKITKKINITEATHNLCHQERSWEPPRCPNSISNPKQKTKHKKSQVFLKSTKISARHTRDAKTGGAQRGSFSGFGYVFSTFHNAKKAPGTRQSA